MPKVVNHVDLDSVALTEKEGRNDRSRVKKKVALEGEWVLDPKAGYQFRTEVQYEKGKQSIEMDFPSYLGGKGNAPGPMAYCLAGITSCFIGTFATVAATEGVELTKLRVNAQCSVNFAKTLGVADEPVTEGIDFVIEAESRNAGKERLQELVAIAEERCPAVYSMTHVINVNARIA
ncbi:MAG: OsmC family protein [Nitrososphaerota archaeon]|jgi:uncharacterized OsmC-like protein|nr:OsmC family protein [Nitrososphaerota archaeon]MDG6966163.1 OsmC family protein [Nitrososphaerota archaeon]MDG6977598.1 OsmC family protein [Nitrososphaerota archaeon]MDG7020352.1 OsmC family protein [Nitrososphaerota archaeon]MDG7022733.1 OsmC family protein [Nitrososphaerota archaeon]